MSDADGPIASPEDAQRSIAPLRAALEAIDPRKTATEAALRAQGRVRAAYVTRALGDAGINLNGYAMKAAGWLANQRLERIAVVLDWLVQAGAAGGVQLLAEASEWIEPCPARPDGRCVHGQWATCARSDLAWRLRGLDPAEARRDALAALGAD